MFNITYSVILDFAHTYHSLTEYRKIIQRPCTLAACKNKQQNLCNLSHAQVKLMSLFVCLMNCSKILMSLDQRNKLFTE